MTRSTARILSATCSSRPVTATNGLGHTLHGLNLLEVAIIAAVLVGIALAVLFFVML